MEDYCIKVKRRGFNYYTDYMERYFEKVAVNIGHHLTKRREHAELWCLTFTGDPSTGAKWITFISDAFGKIPSERLEEISRLLAECFKSESIIEFADDELKELTQMLKSFLKGNCVFSMTDEQHRKYGIPHLWLFSREHSAFDEPPFLTEGDTVLRIDSHDSYCISGERFSVEVQNYGGISKGLTVNISFDTALSEQPVITEPRLVIPRKHDFIWEPIGIERLEDGDRVVFRAKLPEYPIPEGVNIYSTKLCGKKKQDEIDMRSFGLMFIPHGSRELLRSMEIEIIPMEYPAGKAVLKICDLREFPRKEVT